MRRLIHKKKLELVSEQVITLPAGAAILSTDVDVDNDVCVWFIFNPDLKNAPYRRRIFIHGTDHDIHPDAVQFVGTVRQYRPEMTYIWHVWSA